MLGAGEGRLKQHTLLLLLLLIYLICVATESTRDHSGRILANCSYSRFTLSSQVDVDKCLNQSFGLNLSKGLPNRCTVGSKWDHWRVSL